MKRKTLIKALLTACFLLAFILLTSAQNKLERDLMYPATKDGSKYSKHIFYVSYFGFEAGNSNGKVSDIGFTLYGKGTSSIVDEAPAKRVYVSFCPEGKLQKNKYVNGCIQLFYPIKDYQRIYELISNSLRLYVQFFYTDENKDVSYGDIHGELKGNLY